MTHFSDMRLGFLVYFSRSGSTYLASQLAKASTHLLVLPETNIVTTLAKLGNETLSRLAPTELSQLLKSDPQMSTWNLPDSFFDDVADRSVNRDIRSVLQTLATTYGEAHGCNQAKLTIFQRSLILNSFDRIRRSIPDSKFICIQRDPRASISSLVKIGKSEYNKYEREKMGRTDVIGLALRWRKYYRLASQIQRTHVEMMRVIRYDDLCLHPDETIASLLKYLDVDLTSSEGTPQVVSTRDLEIHANIDKGPILDRLNAWQNELAPANGRIIESLLHRELAQQGYDTYFREQRVPVREVMTSWLTQAAAFVGCELRALRRRVSRPSSNAGKPTNSAGNNATS